MKTAIVIQNLKCGGCATTIVDSLSKIDFISNVSVNNEDAIVELEYHGEDKINIIKNKLTQLGYPPLEEENTTFSKVKSYISCAIGRLKVNI